MEPPPSWKDLTRDYRRVRKNRGTLARTSLQRAWYILDDLAGFLDGTAPPVRGRHPRKPVDPHADADVLVAAIDAWFGVHTAWSATTRCTNLGTVRPFLEWAAARGLVTGGVASQITNPRKPKPIPRALPIRDIDVLLSHVPDTRGTAIVLLEAQCTMRRAEVAALRWPGDVDLIEGAILVQGKGGVERVVYPSEETLEALRRWLHDRGTAPGPFICRFSNGRRFPGATPMTPQWIGMLVSRWMRDAGLKQFPGDGVSGHALRHSAATNMLKEGANLRLVQEAMGHAHIGTTARYLRVHDAEIKEAMRKVNYGRRLRVVKDA